MTDPGGGIAILAHLKQLLPFLFAILDQAFLGCSTFFMIVILKRSLGEDEFGRFSVLYAVFLLIAAVYTSLFIEPFMVYGSRRVGHGFREYFDVLVSFHITAFAVLFVPIAIGALAVWWVGRWDWAVNLIAFGISVPLILLSWLFRRVFYVTLQPFRSALGSAVYLGGLVPLLIAFAYTNLLRIDAAFLLSAVSSLASIGAVVWISRADPIWRSSNPVYWREVYWQHFDYGRWSLGSRIVGWASENICYFYLPLFGNLAAAGTFRAVMTLVLPIHQLNMAVSSVLIPRIVKAEQLDNQSEIRRLVLISTAALLAVSSAFVLLIIPLRIPILTWMFGDNAVEHAPLAIYAAIVPFASAVTCTHYAALRAMGFPNQIFWLSLGSALVSVVGGAWLCWSRGAAGALQTLAVSMVVLAIGLILTFWRWLCPAAPLPGAQR